MQEKLQLATFAAGCFWCYEPIFKELRGVKDVKVGYTGGQLENPTYYQVVSGESGHAEAFQVTFDPEKIQYKQLLDVFWYVHDPTSLNRQGYDVGRQYRSVIFYHDVEQKEQAEESIRKLEKEGRFAEPVVTEIVPMREFYIAVEDQQRFYEKYPNQGYCQVIISPKLAKFRQKYSQMLD